MIEEKLIGKVEKTSQIYQSPCTDENNNIVEKENKFLNAVLKIETDLKPFDLLKKCKEIEAEFKRKPKTNYYEAREIDIDILLYGNQIIDDKQENMELNIPHRRMNERLFVLKPLLDIDMSISYFHRESGTIKKAKDILIQLLKSNYNIQIECGDINLYDKLQYLSKTMNIKFSEDQEINFDLGEKTLLMGVVNCTPDSFSGGLLKSKTDIENIIKMLIGNKDLIDLIDIGGESTRPGSSGVTEQEELKRVEEIISRIRESEELTKKIISIDTRKVSVARECLRLGANIINDVSGFTYDPEIIKLAADNYVPYVLMHSRATPDKMQKDQYTSYNNNDCIPEIIEEIEKLIMKIKSDSNDKILDWNIIIDPGIGFSKLGKHNLQIINNLQRIKNHFPNVLLMAHSRKKFIRDILNVDVNQTIIGDVVVAGISIAKGANIIRGHDYLHMNQAIKMSNAILKKF